MSSQLIFPLCLKQLWAELNFKFCLNCPKCYDTVQYDMMIHNTKEHLDSTEGDKADGFTLILVGGVWGSLQARRQKGRRDSRWSPGAMCQFIFPASR